MKKDFLINTIIEVISEFEKHNIRYAILRNYESLNTGLLKDLDLIIDIEDECNIITIINNIYSKNNGLINVQRGFKRTVVSIVTNIGGDVAEEVTFTFDINKYLTLKLKPLHNYFPGLGLNYSIKDLTITTKILGNSDITFKVLKYPQEILFLLNQLIWKKKNEYLTKSNNYLKKINKQPIKDINDNVKIRSSMHDVYILSAILSIQNQFLWKLKILWGNFIVILNQRDSSKIMYFSGPDGSGKTTSVEWTIDILSKLNVKYYRTKSLQQVIIFFLNKREYLIGRLIKKKQVNDKTNNSLDLIRDRDPGNMGWAIRRRIGLFVGLVEICIVGRLLLFFKKLSGHLIIIEESPVDIFVKRHRPQITLLEKIFLPHLPPSDISILCVAEQKTIHERKPELYIEELRDYYNRINWLYSKNKRLSKYDLYTDVPENETRLKIVEYLRMMLK